MSYILTLKGEWDTHAVYADEYPMGVVASARTPSHIIAYGEEYRSNPYGHLCAHRRGPQISAGSR